MYITLYIMLQDNDTGIIYGLAKFAFYGLKLYVGLCIGINVYC